MPFRFSKSSSNRLLGVDPDIFRVARLAIQITKIDFGIPLHGGLRTQAEQNELFHAGYLNVMAMRKLVRTRQARR